MTDGRDGRPPSADAEAAHPSRLCDLFLEALPISGASVSVFDGRGLQSTICASDIVAARLDELQLELGVGPHWDVLRTAHPVLVDDLDDPPPGWTVFAIAARELGARAIFAFPMFLGAVTVGVVALSASTPRPLSPDAIAAAVRLTRRITPRSVHQAVSWADDHEVSEAPAAPAMRREVHQATGMILAQLDVSATEAFFRLRSHAFASSRTVQEIAHAVVTGELDFRDLPD